MANKDKNQGTTVVKRPADAIEVTLPENLTSYLTPIMVLLGAIIIAAAILFTGNKLATSFEAGTKTTAAVQGTTTTDTTAQQQQPKVDLAAVKNLFTDNNIHFGNSDAKLLFVEVSDPSCPYCHVAAGHNPELAKQIGTQFQYKSDSGTYVPPVPEMKKLVDEGKASFVWVYAYGHGSGEIAATALYCANEKGKFWEVNDALMTNAGYTFLNATENAHVKYSPTSDEVSKGFRVYTAADLAKMASFLKNATDESAMKSCLESKKYVANLTTDQTVAASLGVNGTPGFFVNATNYAGAYSYTDMQATVNAALK